MPDVSGAGCEDGISINDGSCIYTPSGFDYSQSALQANYFVESADIDEDSLVLYEDWIGIFNGDVCVGSWPWQGDNSVTSVPAMGDDGSVSTDGYLNDGDYPTFKIYDGSEDAIYGATASESLPWIAGGSNTLDLSGFSSVSFSIDLHYGANLVSFYALPEDVSVSNVMTTIQESVEGVIGEGVAANLLPNGAWVGSLTEIDRLSGYWIKQAFDDELEVEGTLTDPNSIYSLHYGANLISYPFPVSNSLYNALPEVAGENLGGIIGEGVAANLLPNGVWVGSLTQFEGTKGYWFIVDDLDGFDFSYNTPNALTRSEVRLVNNNVPTGFEYEQSTRQSFYFIENIEDAQIGDWVIAYNDNVVVGAREWIGEYTDIPAMGFDNNLMTAGYCDDNDRITFKLYKNETGELVDMYYQTNIPLWVDNTIQTLGSFKTVSIPDEVSLLPSYPNPFNPSTHVQFSIPSDMNVELKVYDMNGRLVDEIMDSHLIRGYYNIEWNASSFSSGVYFIQLTSGGVQSIQKVVLMK